ncbi:hypothetical protein [Myroides odoratus]|uniref:hypothetical protein n=1 Tax=Myroides odoratus TaxID=256 RepID=UPI00216A76E2|nr:hypothetical protein [Myroides odoratus]MCS4238677.1 hypothetical protein [Myroides odoratus]MDH6600389.1 hypothetical protein [Myroides gitamensis]
MNSLELTYKVEVDRKFLFLDEKIACYLSLHGMGGAIMETPDNSFYYQDRPIGMKLI